MVAIRAASASKLLVTLTNCSINIINNISEFVLAHGSTFEQRLNGALPMIRLD